MLSSGIGLPISAPNKATYPTDPSRSVQLKGFVGTGILCGKDGDNYSTGKTTRTSMAAMIYGIGKVSRQKARHAEGNPSACLFQWRYLFLKDGLSPSADSQGAFREIRA